MNQQPLMGGTGSSNNNAQPLVIPTKKTNRAVTAFNPGRETVSGNINRIIQSDSPLMQQTRSNSKKASTEKGLLNSSAAIAAGEQAVISQATQIAQGDALAFQNQGNREHDITKLNMTFDNDSLLMDKDHTFKSGESVLNREHDKSMLDTQGVQRLNELSVKNSYTESLTKMNAGIQKSRDNMLHGLNLEAMDQQSRLNLDTAMAQLTKQHENSLSNISAQGDVNQYSQYTTSQGNIIAAGMDQLGAIYSNTEMTPAQQAAAVGVIEEQLQTQTEALAVIYDEDYESKPVKPDFSLVNFYNEGASYDYTQPSYDYTQPSYDNSNTLGVSA